MTTSSATDASFDQLQTRIQQRQARIGIIGLGYVGLPLALLYSEQKFRVTGFDIDPRKIDTLAKGGSYIYRIAAEEIQSAKAHGFSATADYSQLTEMDAIIICVPTPLNEYHEPDLSYITDTTHSIAPHLRAGQLVVLESTTYPGTTEEVMIPILEKENLAGLKAARNLPSTGKEFFVAFSPEREDPGNTTVARRDIPKVVGGLNPQASELAGAMYGAIFARTVPVSSPAAAEMTKLLENIYRCVNIALVNELKLLSLRMGIDIWEVIEAASTKPFGFHPFYPGPGLGGHCIPIDPFYLSWKAKEFDFRTRFIELAGEGGCTKLHHMWTDFPPAIAARKPCWQPLAAYDFIAVNPPSSVAGVDHQFGLFHDLPVVVVRVVGHDDDAVILSQILQLRALHLQIIFPALANEREVGIVIADLGSIFLQKFDNGERRRLA